MNWGNFESEGHALISGMVLAALAMGEMRCEDFHVEALSDQHGNYVPEVRVSSDLVPGKTFIVRIESADAEKKRLKTAILRTMEELHAARPE